MAAAPIGTLAYKVRTALGRAVAIIQHRRGPQPAVQTGKPNCPGWAANRCLRAISCIKFVYMFGVCCMLYAQTTTHRAPKQDTGRPAHPPGTCTSAPSKPLQTSLQQQSFRLQLPGRH